MWCSESLPELIEPYKKITKRMEGIPRLIELMAEMLHEQRTTNKRLESVEKQQANTNLAIGELRVSVMRLADEIEKIVLLDQRVSKLEDVVFKKSAWLHLLIYKITLKMEGIPRLIELMAEMLHEQRQTNVRLESMDNRMESTNKRLESLEKQQANTNLAIGELRVSVMRLADEIEKIVLLDQRVSKLEDVVFRKSAWQDLTSGSGEGCETWSLFLALNFLQKSVLCGTAPQSAGPA
jgi:hypothetical protein